MDILGSLLLMGGLGCLLSALTDARFGLTAPVAGLLVLGGVLLAVLFKQEQGVANSILRLDLFRHSDFSGATLAAFVSGAAVLALMSMVPTILVRGTGELRLGFADVLIPDKHPVFAASRSSGSCRRTHSPYPSPRHRRQHAGHVAQSSHVAAAVKPEGRLRFSAGTHPRVLLSGDRRGA